VETLWVAVLRVDALPILVDNRCTIAGWGTSEVAAFKKFTGISGMSGVGRTRYYMRFLYKIPLIGRSRPKVAVPYSFVGVSNVLKVAV
jgi:hypothetical protein